MEQEIVSGNGMSSPQTVYHARIHYSVLYEQDALPTTPPTASKCWRTEVN